MLPVGKAPSCIECVHLQLKRASEGSEHVRGVDGIPMLFLCTRAADPLTGNSPESCHTERQVGLCGPRGMFFEKGDFSLSEMNDLADVLADDLDDAPPPVVQPGEEFEDE